MSLLARRVSTFTTLLWLLMNMLQRSPRKYRATGSDGGSEGQIGKLWIGRCLFAVAPSKRDCFKRTPLAKMKHCIVSQPESNKNLTRDFMRRWEENIWREKSSRSLFLLNI